MRVLAHIHTHNDAAVIDQAIGARLRQTRPLDRIVVVDNGSTDDTLDRHFPPQVVLIRHETNLGTSGSIITGLDYAIANAFDWMCILDADSAPEPNVLDGLLAFYERLAAVEQQQVCFLACWPFGAGDYVKESPIRFTKFGIEYLSINENAPHTQCDCTLWSGSLYRLAAVAVIGLPAADYVLDIAELEYGYRAHRSGYISYIVHDLAIHHDVGRPPGAVSRRYGLGTINFLLVDLSPIRCYHSMRNWVYFWFYQFKPRRNARSARCLVRLVAIMLSFAARPRTHKRHLAACARGAWDGLATHMERHH